MGGMDQPPVGPDEVTGTREPFFKWYTRKPIAWAGTGVTAIGLGLGIGGAIGMSVTSGKADQHAKEIRDFAATDPATNLGADPPCGSTEKAGSDIAGYESACNTLRKDLADYDTNRAVTIVGWSLFGVGAVGTAVYTYLDWYSAKPKPVEPTTGFVRPRVTAIAPTVTPNYQGVGVIGTF